MTGVACVGMHLALLEIECLIASLCAKVDRMEFNGHSVALNNSIGAFSELEARLFGRKNQEATDPVF